MAIQSITILLLVCMCLLLVNVDSTNLPGRNQDAEKWQKDIKVLSGKYFGLLTVERILMDILGNDQDELLKDNHIQKKPVTNSKTETLKCIDQKTTEKNDIVEAYIRDIFPAQANRRLEQSKVSEEESIEDKDPKATQVLTGYETQYKDNHDTPKAETEDDSGESESAEHHIEYNNKRADEIPDEYPGVNFANNQIQKRINTDFGFGSRVTAGSKIARSSLAGQSIFGDYGPGRRRKRAVSQGLAPIQGWGPVDNDEDNDITLLKRYMADTGYGSRVSAGSKVARSMLVGRNLFGSAGPGRK